MAIFVSGRETALIWTALSLLCLGSWPSIPRWLFGKGVGPEALYFPFAFGGQIVATISAFTFGTMGDGKNFISDLNRDDNVSRCLLAALAGLCLCMANNTIFLAVDRVGVVVAMVLQAGLGLSLGTTVDYILEPDKSNPALLFPGCVVAFLAVLVSSVVKHYQQQTPYQQVNESESGVNVIHIKATAHSRMRMRSGILFGLWSGVSIGSFSPIFSLSTSEEGEYFDSAPLMSYTAFFIFSSSYCIASLATHAFNVWLKGSAVPSNVSSGLVAAVAVGAGVVCSTGNLLQFVAGEAIGYANTFAIVQCNPLVGALWGVLLWKEYHGTTAKVKLLVTLMVVMYCIAVALVALSIE